MIVKSVSHKSSKKASIKKLIRYVFERDKLTDRYRDRKPLVQKKFLQGFDKDKWAAQFKENDDRRTFNHKRRTVLRHEIIAFAPEDNRHITREKLKGFIDFYFKHRSLRSKTVAGVHYGRSVHIHFVHSGVGIDGKSTRIDRDDFKKFKIRLQEFQRKRYPELSGSIVDHSKAKSVKLKRTHGEVQMKRHRRVVSEKEKLSLEVKGIASGCKSLDELADKLRSKNHRPYYRNGKLTGIWVSENRKLRLTTLGVSREHLREMTVEQKRIDGLNSLRKKNTISKEIER